MERHAGLAAQHYSVLGWDLIPLRHSLVGHPKEPRRAGDAAHPGDD